MTIYARSCHSQDSDRETHNSGHDTGEGECATVTLCFPTNQ